MPVVTVAPDKFKGSLTAPEAAAAMARGCAAAGFDDVRVVPLADGGDGTLDALVAAVGGSRRRARVTGPLGDPVDAEWAQLPDGTAVADLAPTCLQHLGVPPDPSWALDGTVRGLAPASALLGHEGDRVDDDLALRDVDPLGQRVS